MAYLSTVSYEDFERTLILIKKVNALLYDMDNSDEGYNEYMYYKHDLKRLSESQLNVYKLEQQNEDESDD